MENCSELVISKVTSLLHAHYYGLLIPCVKILNYLHYGKDGENMGRIKMNKTHHVLTLTITMVSDPVKPKVNAHLSHHCTSTEYALNLIEDFVKHHRNRKTTETKKVN